MPNTHILEYSINDTRKTHRNALDASGAVPFGIPRECGAAQPHLLCALARPNRWCHVPQERTASTFEAIWFSHFTARSQRLYVDSSWVAP